jgi:hypothetical protein
MSIGMLHKAYIKMLLLQQEITAAVDFGPREMIANLLTGFTSEIVMWDATQLARELLPEVSLHFARVAGRGEVPVHILRYVVVRPTNDRFKLSEEALSSWLEENVGVQHEMQVETAALSFRKAIDRLSPEGRKRGNRHLSLLVKELHLAA